MRSNIHARRHCAALLLLCVLFLPWAGLAQGADEPGINILVAPPAEGDPNQVEATPVNIEDILSERWGIPSLTALLAEILSLVSQLLVAVICWLLWALMLFVGLMLALAILVLVAAIPAWVVNRIEEFVQAVADSLDAVVNASDALTRGMQKIIADWMSEETRAKPSWMLIGLVCLVVAPLATLANYQLLLFSMESLIPPASDALWLVAGTLAALHAVAGLLFHTFRRRSVRLLLCVGVIVSLGCEAWFSFQRTMALENAASNPVTQTSLGAEPNIGTGVDVNTALVSKQRSAAEIKPTPVESPFSEPAKKDEPPWWSWTAIAMALITLVCGVVEAVGWYAAFHLAGKPLCWTFFAPVYLPAKLLSWMLSGASEGRLAAWVRVELRSIIGSLDEYPVRLRDWRINRVIRRGEAFRNDLDQAEKNAAAQYHFQLAQHDRKLESIRLHCDQVIRRRLHSHDLKERKSAHRHQETLNKAWRAHVTDLQKIVLPNMRQQFSAITEQAVAAIVEEVRKMASDKVALTGEQVAEIVAAIVVEELRKYMGVFSDMNGHYPRNKAGNASYARTNASHNYHSTRKEQ